MFSLEIYEQKGNFLGKKERFAAGAIVEECFKAIIYYNEKNQEVRIRLKHGDKLILETTEKHFETKTE